MNATSFRATCATGDDWEAIADRCLAELCSEPVTANLGFLYVTDALAPHLDSLLQRLREKTGVQDWVGTVGAGICFTGTEIYDEPAAAVMLAMLPEDSYRLLPSGIEPLSDMLVTNSSWLAEKNAHFAIVHGDPRNTYLPQIIESLSTQLDPGFLVGGLTSSNDEHFQQQIAGEITEGGLSGVLFSGEVPVISSLTQGCSPIGGKHVITACSGNIISELDGRAALDVFKQDIGEVLSRELSRVAGYIFAGFPVPGSDTGDYLVRNLIGIDPQEKLLAVGDNLENDTRIMFCRRDGDAAREDMMRMLSDLGRRAQGQIRGGVYYSCLGRGRHQFGENSEELNMIRDQLGDFPLVGFFANGEISHNRLYGYTGVLTLFV
ncbi:MAG: FIST N-terminal domain-containing protein [Gammaproteobacteria bacterium]